MNIFYKIEIKYRKVDDSVSMKIIDDGDNDHNYVFQWV